jgi:cytochrome c oxidase assembly factor CtaG
MRPSNDLEHLLSAPPHLDDEGFTARVMARLPEARAGTRSRRSIVLAASLCAALVGAVMLPGSQVALAAVRDVLEPLSAMPLDPVRSGGALMSLGTTALTVHGVILVMIVWGAVALGRGEAR